MKFWIGVFGYLYILIISMFLLGSKAEVDSKVLVLRCSI